VNYRFNTHCLSFFFDDRYASAFASSSNESGINMSSYCSPLSDYLGVWRWYDSSVVSHEDFSRQRHDSGAVIEAIGS
jgi:hypothetical protein